MTIYCTVTNDLSYDQRMIRICSSLAGAGYTVILVGRKMRTSVALIPQSFHQVRLSCFFSKGKLFYAEYNLRLMFFLLFKKMDCICVIDLDTILPGYFISRIKGIKRVYDAHELFCEMKEIVTRPAVYKQWKKIERYTVPRFTHGYTVNNLIREEFKKMYGVNYEVIRSIPLKTALNIPQKNERYILYQGAVNEGRSFETLIPAMKMVQSTLIICGEGNFLKKAKELVAQNQLQEKILFKGNVLPGALKEITLHAWIGITLFDNTGLSNYYSLANRFFDYLHAGIPQLCVDFPVYREINAQYEVALLTSDLAAGNLASQLNTLLHDDKLYNRLQQNCLAARTVLNWQEEEKKLISFYNKILG
jgi:glycosyltransferase involved in cell wall biosynthesis